MVRNEPDQYFGCQWFDDKYTDKSAKVFPRECKFFQNGYQPMKAATSLIAYYVQLPEEPFAQDADKVGSDGFTDPGGKLDSFQGHSCTTKMPGRLQGVADVPGLTVIGDVDPYDLKQGKIANLWLLAGFSSLAEFGPDAIRTLFRRTPNLRSLPAADFNTYTVTLYDLEVEPWEEKDIVVDEKLSWSEATCQLLGCRPTRTGELWPCILEKAIAAHCGGWDYVHGGNITHAWRLLTGCKEVYTIKKTQSNRFRAFGTFNPNAKRWERMANAPHNPRKLNEGGTSDNGSNLSGTQVETFQGLWPMEWPKVGGGGRLGKDITPGELFNKMCAWDDANYIITALCDKTEGEMKGKGVKKGFMYNVRQIIENCGGTGPDMIELRARRGIREIQFGGWEDGGKKWEENPAVYEACGSPEPHDDGIFWVDREDFFKNFSTIFLCAKRMDDWIEPEAH